mgnify:CR=1 FL=1
MTRQKRPFSFYKRSSKKNSRPIYYAKIRTDDGEEYRVSTGCTSRSAAEIWVQKYLKEKEEEAERQRALEMSMTFRKFAQGFWDHDGRYARSKRARRHTISNGYLDISEGNCRNHLLPKWGKYQLRDLSAGKIDTWVIDLVERNKLAPGTINKILQTLKIMLEQACAEEYISENPAKFVKPVKDNFRPRGVLNPNEIRALIGSSDIWSDFRHYAINLLALSTGMRLGEIRGLLVTNIFDDHIEIRHSWEQQYGLKEPKCGSVRDIPISSQINAVMEQVLFTTRPKSIVFYGPNYETPMSKNHIEKNLYNAYNKIGIDEVDRRKRNLTFHSHRHTLNTVLRSSGVNDAKIRRITGHRNENMTDRYTHFQLNDFREVVSIQDNFLEVI